MPRRSTRLESEGAEFLVLGQLLIRGMEAYKAYHSKTFAFPHKLLEKLRSVQLAQQFVGGVLLPRAKRNDCLIVVTRSGRYWGLTGRRNVVIYEGSETRSAHLSPSSRGGNSILRFLTRRYQSLAA